MLHARPAATIFPLDVAASTVMQRQRVFDAVFAKSYVSVVLLFFFFFQAEDGIRDLTVTGVQTCALPIFIPSLVSTCSVPVKAPINGCRVEALSGWICVPTADIAGLKSTSRRSLINGDRKSVV